ncbi:MAG TPA: DUF5682 family protein, partial [Bacillota bacterium]|nr:DUF5682 family protein [Bacillota bacterium]
MKSQQPTTILIEGPAALTKWIPDLLRPELKTPVAVYIIWSDRERKIIRTNDIPGPTPPRFTAYYPFCDYSPELVALREGQKSGAELYFIDLTYPDQMMSDSRLLEKNPEDWRNFSLLQEAHFASSQYVKQLSRVTGCRDHDDLWDHLFEVHSQATKTKQFIKNVAAYCYMARRDFDESVLEFDGTL